MNSLITTLFVVGDPRSLDIPHDWNIQSNAETTLLKLVTTIFVFFILFGIGAVALILLSTLN